MPRSLRKQKSTDSLHHSQNNKTSSLYSSSAKSLLELRLPTLPIELRKHQKKLVYRVVQQRQNLLFIAGTGSGKTISAIVSGLGLLVQKAIEHVTIVTPKSVRTQFESEVRRIVPVEWRGAYTVTTHHQYFRSTQWPYKQAKKSLLVVDEAHSAMATNIHLNTQSHKPTEGKMAYYAIEAARQSKQVLLLTATPIKNSPAELFNLLAAVRQVSFLEFEQWVQPWKKVILRQTKDYVRKGNKFALVRTNNLLGLYAQQIAPFIQFARSSNEGFPKQIDKPVHLTMDPTYLKLYNAAEADKTEAFIREIKKKENQRSDATQSSKTESYTHVPLQYLFDPHSVNAFYTKLRQAVNGYTKNVVSSKIEYTVKILIECHRKKRRALAYSHFLNGGLLLVADKLRNKYNIPFVSIIGSTSEEYRHKHVNALNDPRNNINILLISEAGSEGIDLKEVRDVVILEPHFHEAVTQQVIGRAVRFKSHAELPPNEQNVTIHRILLSKPISNGRRWEDIDTQNDTKLRHLIDKYALLIHQEEHAHTTIELTLNMAVRDAVQSVLETIDLPKTTFVYVETLKSTDWRILIIIRGGFDFFRADDDYDDIVYLDEPPTDLSVDDILDRMSGRKKTLVNTHLQLLRKHARRYSV